MDSHEDRFILIPFSLYEYGVFETGYFFTKWNQIKISICCRKLDTLALFDSAFSFEPIGDESLDRDDFESEFFSDNHEFRESCHRTIFIHDLDESSASLQSCKLHKIDGRFCMPSAYEDTLGTSTKWEDMPWTSKL